MENLSFIQIVFLAVKIFIKKINISSGFQK